jgi:hypothetical protein
VKFMYAALVRGAERWRGIRMTEFERRQLQAPASGRERLCTLSAKMAGPCPRVKPGPAGWTGPRRHLMCQTGCPNNQPRRPSACGDPWPRLRLAHRAVAGRDKETAWSVAWSLAGHPASSKPQRGHKGQDLGRDNPFHHRGSQRAAMRGT